MKAKESAILENGLRTNGELEFLVIPESITCAEVLDQHFLHGDILLTL